MTQPYQETHAVTDDNGRQLYTVTTVQGFPPSHADAVDALNAQRAALAQMARELSERLQGVKP